MKQSLSASEKAKTRIGNAMSEFETLKRDLEEINNRSKELVMSTSHSANNLDTAKEQILKVSSLYTIYCKYRSLRPVLVDG